MWWWCGGGGEVLAGIGGYTLPLDTLDVSRNLLMGLVTHTDCSPTLCLFVQEVSVVVHFLSPMH